MVSVKNSPPKSAGRQSLRVSATTCVGHRKIAGLKNASDFLEMTDVGQPDMNGGNRLCRQETDKKKPNRHVIMPGGRRAGS